MRLDPSDLCVTERPETGRVPVECGKRTGRLRHPEIKIGELSGKLVEVIAREALELFGDQGGALDGIGDDALR